MSTHEKDGGSTRAKKAGDFLLRAYRATGMSRQEAADRAGISPSYLTGILAGRVVTPAPETLRRMADHWGFSLIDFFIETGLLTRSDIQKYLEKERVTPSRELDELTSVYTRIKSLPPSRRERILSSIQSLLNAVDA